MGKAIPFPQRHFFPNGISVGMSRSFCLGVSDVVLTFFPFLDPSGMVALFSLASPERVGFRMGKKNLPEEQIASALRQAESGTSVAKIIRKFGISEQTFLSAEDTVRRAWRRRTAAASDFGGGEQEADATGC